MNNLKDILRSDKILMFGYCDKNLPIDLNIQDEKFCIYSKTPKELIGRSYEKFVRKIIYSSKINIFDIYGSVSFSKKTKYLFNFVKDNIKNTKY